MAHPSRTQLTALEHKALGLSKNGAEVVRSRTPDRGQVSRAVANRLVLRNLAAIVDGKLRITAEGKRVYSQPLSPKPAVYLHRRDGLTTRRDLAARDEPEVMDADDLRPDWAQKAEALRMLERANANAMRLSGLTHPEERLRELRRMAAQRGVDVSDEMRFVDRGLRALERKIRGQEDAA